MIVLRRRPSLAQRAWWAFLDRRIENLAEANRRRVLEYRGAAHYDARGYLERYPEIYNVGHRGFWSEGRFIKAIAGGAWSPPIGIPDPGFGIDTPVMPSLPSPWNADTAGFFYIKQGGTNNAPSNGYGFPASPGGIIPDPIPAGAVVVMDNTTAWTGNTRVTFAGTSGSPSFLVGASLSKSSRAQMNITADGWIDGTWGVIEFIDFFFNFSDGVFWGQFADADHIAFRHNIWRGNGSSTVSHASMQWASQHGFSRNMVVIYDCDEHDIGVVQPGADIDAHALKVDSDTANGWILDSTFTNIGGDAVQMGPQGLSAVNDWTNNHCYMGRCVITTTRQSGGWVKHARDIVFSQNTVSAQAGDVGAASTPGSGFGKQEGGDRIWWLFNHVYDFTGNTECAFQVLQNLTTSDEGVELYAIGNVAHDIGGTGFTWHGGIQCQSNVTDAIYVVGNTFYGMENGIIKRNSGVTVHMWNNILDNISNAHILFEPNVDGSTQRNNAFGQHGSQAFRIQQYAGTTYTNMTTWAAVAGSLASNNINPVNANLVYTDPTNGNHGLRDFSPLSGSATIDAGALINSPLDVYGRYATLYGLSITRDFSDVARPQNSVWDIGAYEFDTGAPPDAPPASPVRHGRRLRGVVIA